jgi:hypothetical protein
MTEANTALRAYRPWWPIPAALGVLLAVGIVSAAFVIAPTSSGAGGQTNGSTFMTHWQQTEVRSGATPNPVPGAVSLAVATPTRLGGASGSLRLNAAVAAHEAVEWTFTESVGATTNQELEVAFAVEYTVGVVFHNATLTAFLESQAAAIGATLTFNIYWDSGAAAGITFVSESEISQACSAVGVCP